MSFPEKLLADDEQVVKHLHPHWITLVPAVAWFIVICAAGGAAIAFLPTGSAHTPLLIGIIVVGLALLSWLSFTPWISWRADHYVFTTHRVLIRRGIIHHTGRDISLQRINDVGYSQTLWDRIVKAGTLTIESAGEHGQETLINVPRSSEVQQMLNRLIEEDHDRRYPPVQPQPQPQPQPQQFYPGQQPYPPQTYPGQQPYPPQGYPGQPTYPAPPGYPGTQPYTNPYPPQQ